MVEAIVCSEVGKESVKGNNVPENSKLSETSSNKDVKLKKGEESLENNSNDKQIDIDKPTDLSNIQLDSDSNYVDIDRPADLSNIKLDPDSNYIDIDKPADLSQVQLDAENSKINWEKQTDLSDINLNMDCDYVDVDKQLDLSDTKTNTEKKFYNKEGVLEKDNNEILEDKASFDKEKIKEETLWSDTIIDHIDSIEQYDIYKNAGLHEAVIDGRPCLVKDYIDPNYIDPKTGFTNKELMAKERAPIDSRTGEKIELHHMQQDYNGPFAELCGMSEHGDGNYKILHDVTKESWRHDSEKLKCYERDRRNHWKIRAEE